MPHADSAYIPSTIQSKREFWDHVYTQIESLVDDQRVWVSNLANASSVIYNSLKAFHQFGEGERAVNWAGFYIHADLFPQPKLVANGDSPPKDVLQLGPFCGKPACQFIPVGPGKARGVCADAYTRASTILVTDVEAYPGHIACDGETKSEIVCPLIWETTGERKVLGVLDMDCLALHGFQDEDKEGLERIAGLVVRSSDW
ncbi:GAF domain nucleotide-binding protein [Coprinopsis marcescibilis]|uniref:GAF domain nucleotide-binding protein n=1 Tax=Coprinopsis marcescibilis TaxID=230819 RepID=A0A5C3KXC4_COPMA|nr:GAF domain nucleotide-binding protein [Coprinopsis marcescibilis]